MSLPVLSVEQMRKWEAATWASGVREQEVIAQVGLGLAKRLMRLCAEGETILLLAGKGHNGDDVRAAAPHLACRRVALINVTDPAQGLREFAARLREKPAWIVDGLFGIGLNRPLDAGWVALLNHINSKGVPILAVDTPSGLDAATGLTQGAAIRAAVTLTIGAPKKGLLAPGAIPFVGRLEVLEDTGLLPLDLQAGPAESESGEGERWIHEKDFQKFPPLRPVDGHKGTFGHAVILAGGEGYHGAAVLAARGASRACPGLVTLGTSAEVYAPVASQLQSVMVRPVAGLEEFIEAVSPDALCAGPGLAGPVARQRFQAATARAFAEFPKPMVVDAAALDWIEPVSAPIEALRVLTPHPGEAARLLGLTAAGVQADRPGSLRGLSRRFGCAWVVLKGHQTLIGRANGPLWVNSTGNPLLAQGGSGDLLAGFLTGLLAQPLLDAPTSIRFAVWRHGQAADDLSAGHPRWTIEQLAGLL